MAPKVQSILCLGAAIALSACNVSSNPTVPAATSTAAAPASAKPDWPTLPEAAKCTGDLNNYQTVLAADVRSGNLNQSVYDEVQTELAKAAQACAAGRDAEAQSLVRSSKARHGYRA